MGRSRGDPVAGAVGRDERGQDLVAAVLDEQRVWRRERWIAAEETEVPGVIEYQTHYRLQDGRHLQARSRIAFPGFDELSVALDAAGLRVDRWYGDAAGGPLRVGCPDFIPVGTLAS